MFDNMFDNIGGKIKTLAKVLCWVGIIFSVLIAIILFIEAKEGSYRTEDLYMKLGCIYLIFGPLISWVSSFFMYGFGELIERTTEVALNTRHLRQATRNNKDNSLNRNIISDSEDSHKWRCEKCGLLINKTPCPNCGYKEKTEREKTLDKLLAAGLITEAEYNEKMKD